MFLPGTSTVLSKQFAKIVVVKKSRSGNLRASLAKPCGIGHVIIELIDDPINLHI